MSPLKLYELVPVKNGPRPSFSPHVWKAKLSLALLKVDHQSVPYSFKQIRNDLAEATGKKDVTVPTIEVDGEYITDSWKVAEYLETKYGSSQSLFCGSEAGKHFAKFINTWANFQLGIAIRPLIQPEIYPQLDSECQEYFRTVKLDPKTLETWTADLRDPETFKANCAKARGVLKTLEVYLRSGGPFIAGKVSYADFCVFGMYAWSRMNPALVKEVWEHDELPEVRKWLRAMMESGLVKQEDLAPLDVHMRSAL